MSCCFTWALASRLGAAMRNSGNFHFSRNLKSSYMRVFHRKPSKATSLEGILSYLKGSKTVSKDF